MSSKTRKINCAFLLGTMAMVLMLALPASATILTFQAAGVASDTSMPQNYGDYVSGSPDGAGHQYLIGNGWTPNVTADYSHDSGAAMRYFNDSEWDEVLYLFGSPGLRFWVTLTPDAGFGVNINSFVLDDYAGYGGGGHTVDWTIYADAVGGAVLANGAEILADGDNLLVPVTMGVYYGTAILEIVKVTGHWADLAVDNLNFDQQAIPEPTSLALLGLAGLTLLQRRRRK